MREPILILPLTKTFSDSAREAAAEARKGKGGMSDEDHKKALSDIHSRLHEAMQHEDNEDSLSNVGEEAFKKAIEDAHPHVKPGSDEEKQLGSLNDRLNRGELTPGDYWDLAKIAGKKG